MKRDIRFAQSILRQRRTYFHEPKGGVGMATKTTEELKAAGARIGMEGPFIDALLAKLGPLALAMALQFLQRLLADLPQGVQAAPKLRCAPGELDRLDADIEKLAEGLAGMIRHRECCCCEE